MDFNLQRVARNMTRNMYGTDIVANNLANSSTTGFKRDAAFTDWLMEAKELGATQRYTNYSQGEMIKTENNLDVALAGAGFFVVETNAGLGFTRNGHFKIGEDGLLRTAQGHIVHGENGPIPALSGDGLASSIEVTRNGEVLIDNLVVDRLAVASIPNLNSLKKLGANVFQVDTDAMVVQMDPNDIDVRQGMLEGANVQPVLEMVNLIDLQRNFESTQRVARAMDHILGRAVQLSDYR
jgi:flagellar basal body rod protein FlgG